MPSVFTISSLFFFTHYTLYLLLYIKTTQYCVESSNIILTLIFHLCSKLFVAVQENGFRVWTLDFWPCRENPRDDRYMHYNTCLQIFRCSWTASISFSLLIIETKLYQIYASLVGWKRLPYIQCNKGEGEYKFNILSV